MSLVRSKLPLLLTTAVVASPFAITSVVHEDEPSRPQTAAERAKDIRTSDGLDDARSDAERECGPQGAVTYDVQGQNQLVYACNSDGRLRTRGY